MLLEAKRELDALRDSVKRELKNVSNKQQKEFNNGVLVGIETALTVIKEKLKEV